MQKQPFHLFAVLGASILGVDASRALAGPPKSLSYELRAESSYTHGCFEPCLCPISIDQPLPA